MTAFSIYMLLTNILDMFFWGGTLRHYPT